jgi:hypothetical protein
MDTTTEIIHAIYFSISEKFVFVITNNKNQAGNKEGIEAKKENTDIKKTTTAQSGLPGSFLKRKYIIKTKG